MRRDQQDDDLLGVREAAERLGLHYMTVYKKVRTGRIPAVRDGGRWLVRLADLTESPDSAIPAEPARLRSVDWADRLVHRLVEGDVGGAWTIIEESMASGHDPVSIHLDVFTPALKAIGDMWESGRIDVAVEHQASAIVFRLLGRLGPRFSRRGRSVGTFVIGTPPGERHSLPGAIVADVLRACRWEVVELGCDVPDDSFQRILTAQDRLVAVGLSVTTPGRDDITASTIERLRAVTDGRLPILVGGSAIRDPSHARALGATEYSTAAEAADLLATLR